MASMMIPLLRLLRDALCARPRSCVRRLGRCFFAGDGDRWIRGLLAQNPCVIGTEAVHRRVDSRGLLCTPGKDLALAPLLQPGHEGPEPRRPLGGVEAGGGVAEVA